MTRYRVVPQKDGSYGVEITKPGEEPVVINRFWMREDPVRCVCLAGHCPLDERAEKRAIARSERQGAGSMAPGETQQEAGETARPEFAGEIAIDEDRGEVGVFGALESANC